jgi:hypothetical protein
MDLKDKIYKRIESYLPHKAKEKSNHGEVFTPVPMIDQMYDNFPPSVLKSPTFTWLDPATGIGNFMIILYFRLMETLKSVIPGEKARSKHIIEKMLFMAEINKENVKTCRAIFNELCPAATPNIFEGDFLEFYQENERNHGRRFNCIVGNPPYNIGGTGLEGKKRTHVLFTEKGLDLLAPAGYLAYICPPSYRELGSRMNKLFQDRGGHFVYIKIYGANETFRLFRIQARVDTFIYQNTNPTHTTTIDDEYDVVTKNIHVDLSRHLPNFGYTIFNKLAAKVNTLGAVKAFRNTELSTVKANSFGCGGRHKLLHLIVADGKRVYKVPKAHELETTKKLLINGLGIPYVYYDKKGQYGPSQSPIIVLNPSANLVNLCQSDFFAFIAWGLRLTGNNNLPYLFEYVPDVSSEKNPYKSMADIQRGFNLTNAEVDFIGQHFHRYEYKDVDKVEKCVAKTRTARQSRVSKTMKNK